MISFRFVSFRFVSQFTDFVSFRHISFRFVVFRFVSLCFVSVSFLTLQGPLFQQDTNIYFDITICYFLIFKMLLFLYFKIPLLLIITFVTSSSGIPTEICQNYKYMYNQCLPLTNWMCDKPNDYIPLDL